MDSQLIREMTLEGRELLTTEVTELLEGVYGLHKGGEFESADRLPALGSNPEIMGTRRRLERFLADEKTAGVTAGEAFNKLVKEVAFTHLNRFVAFRMLEARHLTRGTVDRLHESNAFKFYLADPEHAKDLERFEAGDVPKDALGEGPRDIAYRHFLLWQSARIAREIRVLFDPDNLASQLFPRPRVLGSVVELLTRASLQEAWQPGNEETIGWIYQYFNEPDLEVFRSPRGPKVPPQLVAARSQQFTPRWIVKFLVHNTLGRLWLQMHPDSDLDESLDYLVPLANHVPSIPVKPVREISLLDPACGTMHFGLVAFDVLTEMYREEMKHAGEPGWPKVSSVSRDDEIPQFIIAHNLFGIDIDLRAVQLSALTLYLKAKSLTPQAVITASNLASADVLLLDGNRLDEFLAEMAFSRPVYERVIRALWTRLKGAGQLGSLLRVEKDVRLLVDQERRAHAADLPLLPDAERFADALAGGESFWELLDVQIVQAFDEFARRQAARGEDVGFFADEAVKGFKVLNLMMGRYDIVVTNPPYLDSRDYNAELKSFLDANYPTTKRNLYSSFLERCLELLTDTGRLGIVTPQTFMFISSFEKTRAILRKHVAIETMVHTGLNTFSDAVVDAAFYVLRREARAEHRDNAVGTYFRLVKEPDAETKRRGLEYAVEQVAGGKDSARVFRYRQGDFDAILGSPWVYWITPTLRLLFQTLPRLGEIAQPKHGLSTCDNFRFLRFWWEEGSRRIAFGCSDARKAQLSGKQWFPYMKGGSFRRWWGNQKYIVNWGGDGAEIKADIVRRFPYLRGNWGMVVTNPDFYFRRGVTYSYLTSGRFSARLSPGGFIFDVAGSSLFPEDIQLVLAVMNSTFAAYALSLINPTVNFQVGDLARLPIPPVSSGTLHQLVDEAIALAKAKSEQDETTYEFVAPPSWDRGVRDVAADTFRQSQIEQQTDREVFALYNVSENDKAAIQAELADAVVVLDDPDDSNPPVHGEVDEPEEPSKELTNSELAIRWLSYAAGIVLGRFQPGADGSALGRGTFPVDVASKLKGLTRPDGISPLDNGHEEDLATLVERCLELMLGEGGATEVIRSAVGDKQLGQKPLQRFFERDFFKAHINLYGKRPIYWLLQSSRRSYGVYVFHERLTKDTLYVIQGNRYLGTKINRTRQRTEDLRRSVQSLQGAARRKLERELEEGQAVLAELEEFAKVLETITATRNERGETVGWAPELDDGVILNMAPLHTILPSWSTEPKRYWQRLAAGDYDWSHTAMRYWPERVTSKCRTDKSCAIAHSLLNVNEAKVS